MLVSRYPIPRFPNFTIIISIFGIILVGVVHNLHRRWHRKSHGRNDRPHRGGAVAEWVRALTWTGDRSVPGRVRVPLTAENFASELWQLRLSRFASRPVSFGGDTET